MRHSTLVDALARSLLEGEATNGLILSRCWRTLGRRWNWVRPLARRYQEKFGAGTRPRHREVVLFLRNDAGFERAWSKHSAELVIADPLKLSQKMQPARDTWDVPPIESTADLARWLGLDPGELRWFADLKGLGYKHLTEALRHYHYRVLVKRSGSIRLIEAPKSRLKDLQLQILRWVLEKIPAHPAVHGFVTGRSIRSFVGPHVGRRVVLRMDVQEFFPTIGGVRIQNVFRTLGYPEAVADLLGGICSNATPREVWNDIGPRVPTEAVGAARALYSRPHLPQGAPTSPALANFCFYRLDCRLSALAKSAGAAYTRYADDLAFSGDEEFEKRAERFRTHVAAVLLEEGFRVQHRKTRVMKPGVRQHLAGLVVNEKANVARRDFDRLKALLTNCVRHGAESQNRERRPHFREHLEGRLGFVEMVNPEKGRRLRAIFERISWTE